VESRMSDMVQGYTAYASALLERWGELASRAASKMDAGAYDAASAARDTAAGATLAAEAGWLWTEWMFESLATFTGFEGGANIARSQPFKALAGARLELAEPLVRRPGLDELPVGVVHIHPRQLGPEETEFTLRADGSGHRGGTYVGKVKATSGTESKTVPVWITIP
jgi:hypothetical protein